MFSPKAGNSLSIAGGEVRCSGRSEKSSAVPISRLIEAVLFSDASDMCCDEEGVCEDSLIY